MCTCQNFKHKNTALCFNVWLERTLQTLDYGAKIWSVQKTPGSYKNIHNELYSAQRRSQTSYTCTIVVLSVLEAFVLQVCGCHRKTYGPGCLCLPVGKILPFIGEKWTWTLGILTEQISSRSGHKAAGVHGTNWTIIRSHLQSHIWFTDKVIYKTR